MKKKGEPHVWLEEGEEEISSFFCLIRIMIQKGGEKVKEKGENWEK